MHLGCSHQNEPGPLTPQQALKSFQINPDFRIELYAAEPHVVDPVEIVFDEDGRAFVAEMRDYPNDPPPGTPPRSRIRVLEDTDGDGQVDRAVIFADQLLQVNSVLPWKQGLLVTAAPDILYLKDTDGDGKADIRKVLFTGFSVGSSEHRVSSLRFGVDNWIYAANDGQPGEIKFLERPDAKPLSVSGADFRFRLDHGLFEAESGPAQFGLAIDDWGRRFMTQNTVHVRHALIPMRYLNRNPYLGAGVVALDISDHGQPSARMFPLTRPQAWREARTKLRQQRYRENKLDRVEYAGGYFTAASGGTIYQGNQFPERCRGNLFTGDVSGNLVHRDVLEAVGTSFIAHRAREEQDREFLASTDPWFRPCNFATGPDGNLYVVDMYREFIEGPEFIPEELRKGMDFYNGNTLGRIYRVVPKNAAPSRSVRPNLSKADSSQLVTLLSHANGWWRLTAQRLLLERQDSSLIPLLKSRVTGDSSALGRLHALYVLEGLSALDGSLVESALHDTEPGIREHAVRLAEKFPRDHVALAEMVGDSSINVQFQLALSLGEVPAGIAVMPLAKLALKHSADPWFRTAILSSRAGSSVQLLRAMTRDPGFQKNALSDLVRELATVIGARNSPDEISRLAGLMAGVRSLRSDDLRTAGLEGLARGLKLAGANRLRISQSEALIDSSMKSSSERVRLAARSVARYFELPALVNRAKREALDASLPQARREMAILDLGGGQLVEVRSTIDELLASQLDPGLLKAIFRCLSGFDDPEVAQMVVTRWKNLGPSIRGDALDVLLNQAQRVPALLTALENGQIERSSLDWARKEKLLNQPDSAIGQRARRLLQEESSDRGRLVTSYSAALSHKGDPAKGKALFEKHCASCHRVKDGHRIGPDLSGVSSNTKVQLLQSILDPSKTIDPHYINYFVISKDGRIHDGLIVAESPGTLTLRRAEAEDETILRSRITGMRASMVSLMPEGFEKDVSPPAMADLIAFLQGGVSQ